MENIFIILIIHRVKMSKRFRDNNQDNKKIKKGNLNNNENLRGDKESESSYDSELVAKSLGKVGKGAGILFIGTIFGLLFNFFSRVLIARFYTPADYGLFNLYFTILSIFAAIGGIGLRNGIQRNVSYYLGKDEVEKVPAIISWGLAIALAAGIVFGIVLFIFANPIASLFSEDPALGDYYRIAAIAVPFYIITIALVSVFRGFQRTKEKILFYNLGRNTLILIFITTIGIFALPFENIIWGVSISVILIAISLFIWYLKTHEKNLGIKKVGKWESSVGKKLLLFSLPLLLVDLSYRVMGWTDTMMIGYFLIEDSVGYYQVAKPLSRFIQTGLSVVTFIYAPIAASFYARNQNHEHRVMFTVITKWVCFSILPVALIFIFYPEWVIGSFFGVGYTTAIVPLQILSIITFFILIMGPHASALTAYGKTKFLMYATGGAAFLNIMLNILLIPYYGIIGAALATGFSKLSLNIVRVKKLKRLSGIHSIRLEIIKPIVITILCSLLIVIVFKLFLPISLVTIVISGIFFYIFLILSIILTNNLSKSDIKLLLLIEKRIGMDLSMVKKLFNKLT